MEVKTDLAKNYLTNVLRPDVDDLGKQKAYSEWSKRYDQDQIDLNYTGPNKVGKVMNSLFQTSPDSIRILDIAAGTGLVADELQKYGFTNIDALEPNTEMLAFAKEKRIYKNYFIELVPEKGPTSVADNSYDVVTCSGSFGDGHLPSNVVNEMIRISKPDGFVIIAANCEHMPRMTDILARCEKTGRWRKLKEEILRNYVAGKDGVLLIYRVE